MKNTLTLVAALAILTCGSAFAEPTHLNALQTVGTGDTLEYSSTLENGDVHVGEDLTVDDDATIGGDLTVTGAISGQVSSGQTIILPFYMDSPASPEVVSMAAPADGTIRRVDYVLRTGTATVVLRNDTDGDNLATLSLTSTSATTTTISSAEEVDAEDLIKLTVTADSSAAEGLIWVYLVTSSAISPEG